MKHMVGETEGCGGKNERIWWGKGGWGKGVGE